MKRLSIFLLLVGLLVGSGLMVANRAHVSVSTNQARAAVVEPWPPFTIVYRVEGHFHGLDQPTIYDVWRVNYADRNHWETELLESSRDPDQVGTRKQFEGSTYREFSPRLGTTFESEAVSDFAAPNDWLAPGLRNRLVSRGYRVIETDNRLKLHKEREVTCRGGPPACPDPGKTRYLSTSDFILTREHEIPVEVVDKLDDVVLRRIVVLELTLE